MSDTILNYIFNGFFVITCIFTVIFTVMLVMEDYRK